MGRQPTRPNIPAPQNSAPSYIPCSLTFKHIRRDEEAPDANVFSHTSAPSFRRRNPHAAATSHGVSAEGSTDVSIPGALGNHHSCRPAPVVPPLSRPSVRSLPNSTAEVSSPTHWGEGDETEEKQDIENSASIPVEP